MSTLKKLSGWVLSLSIMVVTADMLYTNGLDAISVLCLLPAILLSVLLMIYLIKQTQREGLFNKKVLARAQALEFIKSYEFPELVKKSFMIENLMSHTNYEHVSNGLKQYLGAYAYEVHSGTANNKKILMPSKIVDELWHEFILSTREYKNFCDKAFAGGFLHHLPAGTPDIGDERKALLHTFRALEKIEDYGFSYKIDGVFNLFALDNYLEIKEGFIYNKDSMSEIKKEAKEKEAVLNADNTISSTDGYFSGWLWLGDDSTSYNSYVSDVSHDSSYSMHSVSACSSSSCSSSSCSSSTSSCSSSSCSSSSCSSSSCSSSGGG